MTVDTSAAPLLQVDGLSRSFGGLKAVNGVSFSIERGDVMGLIGSNGAGKTTLLHLLYGQDRPDAGQVIFEGVDVTSWPARRKARYGMGLVFQRTNVFAGLTVEENLKLGANPKTGYGWSTKSSKTDGRIEAMLATIDLLAERYTVAGDLSHGQQQWLEIGLVLLTEPRLLFLDEPTSGMTRDETLRTAALLRELRDTQMAAAMLVVEHNIEFMKMISDRVTVMHRGQVLAEGTLAEVEANPSVRDSYLGRLQ